MPLAFRRNIGLMVDELAPSAPRPGGVLGPLEPVRVVENVVRDRPVRVGDVSTEPRRAPRLLLRRLECDPGARPAQAAPRPYSLMLRVFDDERLHVLLVLTGEFDIVERERVLRVRLCVS